MNNMDGEAKAKKQNSYKNLCLKYNIPFKLSDVELMSRPELKREIKKIRNQFE